MMAKIYCTHGFEIDYNYSCEVCKIHQLSEENRELKEELEQDIPTEIVILRQKNTQLRELLGRAYLVLEKFAPDDEVFDEIEKELKEEK